MIKTSVFDDAGSGDTDDDGNGTAQVGETITYSFRVTNTGSTTLTNITLEDVLLEGANGTLSGGPIASLSPGAFDDTTFTGSYTITQDDIDRGFVRNQAVVSGETPDGNTVSDDSDDDSNVGDDPTDTDLGQDSSIAVIKTSVFDDAGSGDTDDAGNGTAQVGETITYSFRVTNTGSTTLTNITLEDVLLEGANGTLSGGPIASLSPGAFDDTTFTGSYTITQDDIDRGFVRNQAVVSGETPDGNTVSDDSDDDSNVGDDPTDTDLGQDSSIAVIKTSVWMTPQR
ncbi:DUF7507 domain-containing protein [Nonlabens ponticola]|uniref:DUF7507 domain-containing protein n=1 Tax=Nonlabens ponticola TaxID=2496866 RepID=A0A3S9N0U5_9FLAO|nr:DUF11 domain-containing protein [Nonlabens ponticola]AZQ45111.1 hypothetical protein EJ995_13045 [Nonlabens ponticola]